MRRKHMSSIDKSVASGRTKSSRRMPLVSGKPTILIADDSLDSREMMQVLLESKGYRVLAADNGVRAVEVAVKNHPDAVLLDLQLPKMDGLSVTRSLRQLPVFKSVPIIMLT